VRCLFGTSLGTALQFNELIEILYSKILVLGSMKNKTLIINIQNEISTSKEDAHHTSISKNLLAATDSGIFLCVTTPICLCGTSSFISRTKISEDPAG
jgi:hypothetical protein